MVWPRFRTWRRLPSRSSRSTTSALIRQAVAIALSTSGRAQPERPAGARRRLAKSASSPSTAHFRISYAPERNSRTGSVARNAGSITTARGWWNAPIMFLARAWLMATLPPIELSTIASSVVGTTTQSTPRIHDAAAKPARSPTTPPPSATHQAVAPQASLQEGVVDGFQRAAALEALAVGHEARVQLRPGRAASARGSCRGSSRRVGSPPRPCAGPAAARAGRAAAARARGPPTRRSGGLRARPGSPAWPGSIAPGISGHPVDRSACFSMICAPMRLSPGRAAGLAFLTASVTLLLQVLVHRMVSAKLLNNYAFLVISLTMLGFAFSGVVLSFDLRRFLERLPDAAQPLRERSSWRACCSASHRLLPRRGAGCQFAVSRPGFVVAFFRWMPYSLLFALPFAFCGLILGALLASPGPACTAHLLLGPARLGRRRLRGRSPPSSCSGSRRARSRRAPRSCSARRSSLRRLPRAVRVVLAATAAGLLACVLLKDRALRFATTPRARCSRRPATPARASCSSTRPGTRSRASRCRASRLPIRGRWPFLP